MTDTNWTSRAVDPASIPSFYGYQPVPFDMLNMSEDAARPSSLIHAILGYDVPQGTLFTYLFRRFGFPNKGSHPDRELCRYLLSTPLDNLFLEVSPSPLGNPGLSFTFLLEQQAMTEIRKANPRSGFFDRDVNWRSWTMDDLLRPYAEAAEATLQDLKRPVRLDIQEVTIYGLGDRMVAGAHVPASPSAGHALPLLDDSDPDLLCRFFGLMEKLGDGDPKSRLKAAIAKLEGNP